MRAITLHSDMPPKRMQPTPRAGLSFEALGVRERRNGIKGGSGRG